MRRLRACGGCKDHCGEEQETRDTAAGKEECFLIRTDSKFLRDIPNNISAVRNMKLA